MFIDDAANASQVQIIAWGAQIEKLGATTDAAPGPYALTNATRVQSASTKVSGVSLNGAVNITTPDMPSASTGSAANDPLTVLGGIGGGTTAGTSAGNGGGLSIISGTGGANSSTSGTKAGGVGGTLVVTTGAGGAVTGAGTANNAGAGGGLTLTLGDGGTASGGTANTAGAGGGITITAGRGGQTGATAMGAGGAISITTGGAGGATGNPNAGTLTLDAGALNGSSGTATITIGGTNAKAVNIGTSAIAKTITIGETGATIQTIPIGSGSAANVITIADIQTAGSVSIGNAMTSGTISIGGGSAVRTGNITIGSTGQTSGVTKIIGGTGTGAFGGSTSGIDISPGVAGTINIGASGGAGTGAITIGSSTGTQTVTIAAGNTGVKTVSIADGTAANVITIGNAQTGGSVSVGAAMTTGTITLGGAVAQTGTITIGQSTGTNIVNLGTGTGATTVNIATGATNAKTINIGSGAVANVITIGSTSGAASITLSAGSGNITLNTPAGTRTERLCSNETTGNGVALTTATIGDCTTAGQADYAEMYPTESTADYGDIMAISTEIVQEFQTDSQGVPLLNAPKTNISKLYKASHPYQSNVIGVVSNNYGDPTSTGYGVVADQDHPMPIALNGRVPVRISPSSEPIAAGDYITTSYEAGKGMKATRAGTVIGKALESWSPASSTPAITVFVEQGYYDGESLTDFAGITTEHTIGGNFGKQVLGKFLAEQANATSTTSGASELLVDRLAAGIEIIAPSITAKGLVIDSVSALEDAIKFASDTIFFGRPYFTTDTAGFAVVKAGSRRVEVIFDKDYLEQPIVNATVSLDGMSDTSQSAAAAEAFFTNDIRYLVTKKTLHGFTILLNKPAEQDTQFSWIAFAVKGAKTLNQMAPTLFRHRHLLHQQPLPRILLLR
jgi:hypothetical protein